MFRKFEKTERADDKKHQLLNSTFAALALAVAQPVDADADTDEHDDAQYPQKNLCRCAHASFLTLSMIS